MEKDNQHIENLIKINASLTRGTIKHYEQSGLQYMDVPQIVGITGACENIDTLFRIGNRLDLPLFFTQTGQLALEQALTFSHGVYTIIHSGRDEEDEDERHLRQFRLTEEEFDCTLAGMTREDYDEEVMFDALLSHIESAIKSMIRNVVAENAATLTNLYAQAASYLSDLLDWPFLQIEYEKTIKMLRQNGYPSLSFGDDLKAEHEQEALNLVNYKSGRKENLLPVFITRYPKEIKFFNMKVSQKDSRVVLSSDLIMPISGESVGSAVREHDEQKLRERLVSSQMFKLHKARGGSYQDFTWYVEGLVGSGKSNPHAGYGIGNERVLQFILGQKDIRECSIFYQLAQLSGDWDRTRRGQIHLYSPHKKAILLAVGKISNKRKLLAAIKQIYTKPVTLYATAKTHRFLRKNGIITTRVYKISEGKEPNIKTLLAKGAFDVIVNIPTGRKGSNSEETDGRKIRKAAVESGVTLITELEVAQYLFAKLGRIGNDDSMQKKKAQQFRLTTDLNF